MVIIRFRLQVSVAFACVRIVNNHEVANGRLIPGGPVDLKAFRR
jgi:hypothetical protein